jgi:hypothetical protein
MASRTKEKMANPGPVVRVKRGVAEAKGRALGLAVVKALAPVAEPKRCTTAMHLIPNPLKARVQVDPSGVLQKGENPSTRDPENPETRLKASDLVEDLAYSAIILVVDAV